LNELGGLKGDAPAEPLVRALLSSAVQRLHFLCSALLHRGYPRLAQPPMNLQSDEMLGAVVERLIKALRQVRPQTVRQFFALANQHMRWELNEMARRLDERPHAKELHEEFVAAPESSGSRISPNTARILGAIENLPEEEREVFSLVRIQGMTQAETATLLDVSAKTVQRRLNRSLVLLSEKLNDIRPTQI